MKDILGKMMSLELGLLTVTRDRVKGVVDELIKVGDVSQDEGKKFMDDLIARGEKDKKELKAQLEVMVRDYLKSLDVPTRSEINELKAEITQLRKELTREALEAKVDRSKKTG
jgi:polyhydroxyalkanoate synthesis regulator phasin